MTLPIKPETLPRKAVELLEFIEWLEQSKRWYVCEWYDRLKVPPEELREAVKEYTGVKNNG